MPGVSDFLFGSEPSVSNNPFSLIDPTQTDAEKLAFQTAQNNQNATPYPGQLVAPLSSLQNKSLASLEASAMPTASAGSNTFIDSNKALQDILAKGPMDTTAAF